MKTLLDLNLKSVTETLNPSSAQTDQTTGHTTDTHDQTFDV